MRVKVSAAENGSPTFHGEGDFDEQDSIICPSCQESAAVEKFMPDAWEVSPDHPAKLNEMLYFTCPAGNRSGWYRVKKAGHHDPAKPYEDKVITLGVLTNLIIEAFPSELTRFNTHKVTRPTIAAA